MENLGKTKSDWVRGSCIGRGSFGTVDMAVNKSDGRIFAVKSVNLRSCLATQSDALENEIKILRSISSPWIIEYLSDDVTSENGATSFRNLHLEYMPGGTAADVAKDEWILKSRVYCLVAGLKDVHNAGIVHCDIKGRNVLIGSSPGVAKLADFGSASFVTQTLSDHRAERLVPHGSPLWMAPEVVRAEYQGPESDVWSLGCTVIEMVTGRPPWEDSGTDTLLRVGYSEELPELPDQLSELGKDFVKKCLRHDRAKRWSCDQLLHHPFVSSSHSSDLITHQSPRCVLDWKDSDFSDYEGEEDRLNFSSELVTWSVSGRIAKLASNAGVIWEPDGWVEVRNVINDNDLGTSSEYSDLLGVEVEIHVDTEWVNMEVSHSSDGAEVAATAHGGEFSYVHGHRGFTGSENILFVILLILTAIVCTSIRFTIIKILQLLFRFILRFQSSHVTNLPKLLTFRAVFEIFLVFSSLLFFQNLSKVIKNCWLSSITPQDMGFSISLFFSSVRARICS